MIFQVVVFVLIVLVTLFLATQGMVSALLALITATFSSILAMALTEPLEFLMGNVSVEYQRGVTFLGLYLIIFGITRFVADILVPKNIKVPVLINRLVGGIIGFFAALVAIGTLIIGIEMMPLPSSLLGYNRFPDSNMQGEGQGALARPTGVILGPDRLTLALWDGASGRSLGGNRAFSSVHPDLSIESYGNRRNVQYASKHTVPPEALEVSAAWVSAEPKELDPLDIKLDANKKAVMVRTSIKKGDKPERNASDPDDYFRVTPSEVRLVTDKGHQYFPIGYLDFGTRFTKLDLESGQLVDDFNRGGHVVEDWIFQIPDDEKPTLIEVKQTARGDVAAVLKDKPVPALASSEYPKKPYLKERSTLEVTLSGLSGPLEGKVFVLRQVVERKDVSSEVDSAFNHVEENLTAMSNSSGGWTMDGAPGVPNKGYFQTSRNYAVNDIKNKAPQDAVEWDRVIQLVLAGQVSSDVNKSIASVSNYVNNTLLPLFTNTSTGSDVLASASLDSSGKAELHNIPKGNTVVFGFAKTDKGFYAWSKQIAFEAGSSKSATFSPNDANAVKLEKP